MPIPTAAAPRARALAFALTDADGQILAARDADRPFYAASTIKLHVMLAALRAAADGHLDLEADVPATRTFTGVDGEAFTLGGDHLDPTHPDDGDLIAVGELLTRMIDRSSNEATDHLVELIGLDAVAAGVASLHLTGTRVERLIGDAAAVQRGLTNETSAADLVRTVRALVAPAEGTAHLLARRALAAQQIQIIAGALRPQVPVGSKSGWVDGYRHDVAVIGDPDGDETRHLAVMTAGMEQAEADAAIESEVRRLLPHLAR